MAVLSAGAPLFGCVEADGAKFVPGGCAMVTRGLINRVRDHAKRPAGGYFGTIDYAGLAVPPGLGERAGVLGALALAQRTAR